MRDPQAAPSHDASTTAEQISDVGVAPDSKTTSKKPTMYEKLGGKAAIEAVVDLFYGKVFADEEVSRFFEGINKPRLKAHQVRFMTYAFGGPGEYHGKDMWSAHKKLVREQGLKEKHFDIIVKHLVEALQDAGVPEDDIKAAGEVVQTVRDPMFRDPKTHEFLG